MKVIILCVLLVAASRLVAAEEPNACTDAGYRCEQGNACSLGSIEVEELSSSCTKFCCRSILNMQRCEDTPGNSCVPSNNCSGDRTLDASKLYCQKANDSCCAPNAEDTCSEGASCVNGCPDGQLDIEGTTCGDNGKKCCFPACGTTNGISNCFNDCGVGQNGCGDFYPVRGCNAGGGGGRKCASTDQTCCQPGPCVPESGYCITSADCCGKASCKDGACGPPISNDDPWVNGLSGQRFNFDPKITEDAWFAAVSDETVQINLKLHKYDQGPYAQAAREFWIGASIQTFDEDGFAAQSLLIEARNGDNFDFSCKDLDANAPEHCLGGGAVDIFVNGVRMLEGGQVETGAGFMLAASNIIPACQSITTDQLRAHHEAQQARHLEAFDYETFLTTRGVRKASDCDRWIQTAKRNFGDIYKAPGSRFTLRYSSPRTVSVVEFDTHIPPDLTIEPMTYKISYALLQLAEHEGTEGFMGETARVRVGSDGQPIMTGKVLKGDDADYKVDGPFGRDFTAKHM